MATKQYYHDIDLVKVGQLKGARVENVADATALAAITSPGIGQLVYQVDTDYLKIYDGAAWKQVDFTITGDVVFRGTVDASTSLNAQAVAASGNQYVVTTAGTLTMTGVTFNPTAVAEVGDTILFTDTTTAYVLQRNIVAASETTAGIVELATDAETATGTDTARAITPANLSHAMRTNRYARQYTATVATITADTPFTVSHSLALTSKDAFVCNVMSSTGSAISLDVDSVDADSLTLTSSVNLSNVVVTVIGASSSEFSI